MSENEETSTNEAANRSRDEIERLVIAVASDIRNRDISLGDDVSRWFSDLQGVMKVLSGVQDELGVGLLLTREPTDEIEGLLEGDFFALADWVLGRLQTTGDAA